LSALLVYLSLRGIDYQGLAEGFRTLRYAYVPSILATLLLMQVLRSVRWGLILRPLARIDQRTLFSITSVGFFAIVSLPARLGELARPYLISRRSGIKMSSALGSILVERVLDSLTILFVAVFVLFLMPLPPWLIRTSVFFLLVTLALLAVMIFMILKQDASLRLFSRLSRKLPPRFADALNRAVRHFLDGFRIIADPALLAIVTALSILIWLVDAVAIYLLFHAFGFQLPIAAALTLMIILIIGIAVPTAPGFIGNWHYFCILGLSLFEIPRTEALAFAIVYHTLAIGIVIVLGVAFLPFNRFSLADLRRQSSL
jgi:hypothetical protein